MATRRLRVLAVVPYPPDRAPSQRYRIEQWLPRLEALGVDCDLVPFQDHALYQVMTGPGASGRKAAGLLRAAARRLGLLSRLRRYDVAFLHREAMALGPAVIEPLVARALPLVFDFDDAIWMRNHNPANPLAGLLKFPGKTRTIVRRSAAVLAGNPYLADWARQFNPSTHVVPSTIETEGAYALRKVHEPREVPVIGWSGTWSTLRYLQTLRPALEELARRRPFRLRVIYDGPQVTWPGVDVECVAWSGATEAQDLLEFDVGLMPQPDEEWAKGKCGMKALQYMALGIPPAVSANGVLPEIIRDGRSGVLASTTEEWVTRLEALLADWRLRAALGEEARRTVAERFSAAVQAPRVAEILFRAGHIR